jgi:hypothetical protein
MNGWMDGWMAMDRKFDGMKKASRGDGEGD